MVDKIAVASSFLVQAPPGQINDIFADTRAIVANDDVFTEGIQPALELYNTEQLVVTSLEGRNVLVCEAARLTSSTSDKNGSERFVDPRQGVSFDFHHISAQASDPKPFALDEEIEQLRKEIDAHISKYASNHYNDGVSAVYSLPYPRQQQQEKEKESLKEEEKEGDKEEDKEEKEDTVVDEEKNETSEDTEASTTNDNDETKEEGEQEGKSDEKQEEDVKQEEEKQEEEKQEEEKQGEEKQEEKQEERQEEEDSEEKQEETPLEEKQEQKEEQASAQESAEEQVQVQGPKTIVICMVGNKYNTANFWTGRWRSEYTYTPPSDNTPASLKGSIKINVHYYEQGNVQLSTTKPVEIDFSSTINESTSNDYPAVAKTIFQAISKQEADYQLSLNDVYAEFNEKTFRSLRKALPVTKQRLDWSRMGQYKLASEIRGSQ